MGRMLNTYNLIACVYDPLSRWCLGKGYVQSKYTYLDRIQPGRKILILGGGTGENLAEIGKRIGSEGFVYFFDASSSMIQMAKERFKGAPSKNISFIHSADFSLVGDLHPDIIVTQFFLDVLSDGQLEHLFGQLTQIGGKDREWIFVDFYDVPHKRWLIWILIGLFRILVNHPRKDLPEYSHFFARWGWQEKETCSFMDGFIQAKVFRRK